MSEVFKAGFINQPDQKDNQNNGFVAPDYKSRYDWFISEYITYSLEIPDELKPEYSFLHSQFGKQENDEGIRERLKKFKVSLSDEIPMPDIVLSICDSDGMNKRMVMTRQNISCITAHAKVGKTFLVKLITGSLLQKGTFQNRLNSELPEGKDRILYIDTEQSKFHVQLGMNQIYKMLGEEYKSEFDRLDVYQLDSVSTLDRLEYVKFLVYDEKYDVVILDGVSDLALDSNNLKESDELVTNLRIWATERDLHIINVIHLNPSENNEKMKGHLGTKLRDKSEIVIGVSIDKENDSNRIVQSLASRNRKPDPFQFTISENGMPEINQEEVMVHKIYGKKPNKTEKPDYELYQILTSFFSKDSTKLGYRYGEICNGLQLEYEKKYNETLGDNLTKKLIVKLIDKGFVLKSGDKGFSQYFLGEYKNVVKLGKNEFEIDDNIDFESH